MLQKRRVPYNIVKVKLIKLSIIKIKHYSNLRVQVKKRGGARVKIAFNMIVLAKQMKWERRHPTQEKE